MNWVQSIGMAEVDRGLPCIKLYPAIPVGKLFRCSYKHHDASRTSRSLSESALAAEYEEWPLYGFLGRTRIGSTTSFNLQF